MSDFWKEQFAKYPLAEGVDFVDWFFNPLEPCGRIFQSNTKDELCNGCIAYPKSNRYYWYYKDGIKHYITDKVAVPATVTSIKTIYRVVHDYREQEWFFTSRADAEEFVIFAELDDMYDTFCMHLNYGNNTTPEEAMRAARYAHYNTYSIEAKTLI